MTKTTQKQRRNNARMGLVRCFVVSPDGSQGETTDTNNALNDANNARTTQNNAAPLRKLVARWLDQIGEHNRAERMRVYRIALRNKDTAAMIRRETSDYARHLNAWHQQPTPVFPKPKQPSP